MHEKKPGYFKVSMTQRKISVSISGDCATIKMCKMFSVRKSKTVHKFSWIGRLKGESWEDRITTAKLKNAA